MRGSLGVMDSSHRETMNVFTNPIPPRQFTKKSYKKIRSCYVSLEVECECPPFYLLQDLGPREWTLEPCGVAYPVYTSPISLLPAYMIILSTKPNIAELLFTDGLSVFSLIYKAFRALFFSLDIISVLRISFSTVIRL